ncbi:MAG: pyridoxamine 5'-phosphate oxidase family protein [Thermoplasmata archaeon]|nr:MAG: pyridoxamine 5'-phosphate oxidase family protein [Thermoplasmata archaeon]
MEMGHWEMRKKDQEITDEDELRATLREAHFVTMAMCMEDEPYLVTISHGYDTERNAIYFHCAHEGKKIDILSANPVVWGEAVLDTGYDGPECHQEYVTTQFKGRVSFPEEEGEKRHGLTVLLEQFGADVDKFFAKDDTPEAVRKVNIGRVDIEYMSGKRSG